MVDEKATVPDLILLDAKCVHLFRTESDSTVVRLHLEGEPNYPDCCYRSVKIARAFPFSKPDTYIGLRDGDDKDIGMLVTLDGIDDETRRIVNEELDRRYFLPFWQSTVKIKEEYGVIEWEMVTDKGQRVYFLRNIKDSVQHLGTNRVLVTDPEGNRFEVRDTEKLDPKAWDVLSKAL